MSTTFMALVRFAGRDILELLDKAFDPSGRMVFLGSPARRSLTLTLLPVESVQRLRESAKTPILRKLYFRSMLSEIGIVAKLRNQRRVPPSVKTSREVLIPGHRRIKTCS